MKTEHIKLLNIGKQNISIYKAYQKQNIPKPNLNCIWSWANFETNNVWIKKSGNLNKKYHKLTESKSSLSKGKNLYFYFYFFLGLDMCSIYIFTIIFLSFSEKFNVWYVLYFDMFWHWVWYVLWGDMF